MLKKMILVACGLLLLSGCADHYPKYAESQSEIATKNQALFAQVMGARAARDAVVLPSMAAKSGGDNSSMLLYSIIQSDREAALANAFKTPGLDAPTTGMDVGKAFVGNFLPTLVKVGAGVIISHDLFGALGGGKSGDTYVGGDYTKMDMNSAVGGDGDIVNDILLDQSVTSGIETTPLDLGPLLAP